MRDDTLGLLDKVAGDMTRLAGIIRQDETDAIATGDHVEVIKHFFHLRNAMDQVKKAREALENMAEVLSKHTIPDLATALKERTGVKPPFKIEGVGSVSIANKLNCSIKDHDELGKEPGYDWLRGNNAGDIIKPTVNASTLSAYAKDLIENHGKDMPEDIFTVSIQHYTSIRK